MSDYFDISKTDGLVGCPYDKSHRMLPIRLAAHLIRCARNNPAIKLSRCPFNSTHLLKPEELQSHIKECEHSIDIFKSLSQMAPLEPPVSMVEPVKTSENWDDEPSHPTYNPVNYCETHHIPLQAQGLSKSQRKAFRESQRQHFDSLQNIYT